MSELRMRDGDQVLPTPRLGVASTHDLMVRDLASVRVLNGQPVTTELRRRIVDSVAARKDLGLSRYGAVLQPDAGRDSGQDALEEALDLAAYLYNWMREGASVQGLYDRVLDVVADLVVRTGGLR